MKSLRSHKHIYVYIYIVYVSMWLQQLTKCGTNMLHWISLAWHSPFKAHSSFAEVVGNQLWLILYTQHEHIYMYIYLYIISITASHKTHHNTVNAINFVQTTTSSVRRRDEDWSWFSIGKMTEREKSNERRKYTQCGTDIQRGMGQSQHTRYHTHIHTIPPKMHKMPLHCHTKSQNTSV